MATISELMEGKAPGSVKVRRSRWKGTEYLIPYFCSEGWWHGVTQHGHATNYPDPGDWTLYTEPKKKVAMYLWAIRGSDGEVQQTRYYYKDEEDLRNGPGYTWCQRLDYTKIEVEEDGE